MSSIRVNVSPLAGPNADLVIVKCDGALAAKVAKDITELCKSVVPKKHILTKNFSEKVNDENILTSKKILFVLTEETGDLQLGVQRWMNPFPAVSTSPRSSVLVINESNKSDRYTYQFWTPKRELCNLTTVHVGTLKDVFLWWPNVLEFIYGHRPCFDKSVIVKANAPKQHILPSYRSRSTRASSCDDSLMSSVDTVDQKRLKDNLNRLVRRYRAVTSQLSQYDGKTTVMAVAFNRDLSVRDSAYDRFRQAKINGAIVAFFFSEDVELPEYIRQISSHRFYPSQAMQGILLLFCEFSLGALQLAVPPKPPTPIGPLHVTKEAFYWSRTPLLENSSFSLQQKDAKTGLWVEINPKIPLFSTSYKESRSMDDATREYRLVQEDMDGELSGPLHFREKWPQYFQRKFLAILSLILNIPTLALLLAFLPITAPAYITFRRCKQKIGFLHVEHLERNDKIALLFFWMFCAVVIIGCPAAILLQHIYNTLASVGFWFGIMLPFILLCLNHPIRAVYRRYADSNLLTSTVPAYVIPPLDVFYVFWTNPYQSFKGWGH